MKPDLLLVFTRYPEPGKVKTRLIPALGGAGAASLHQHLTAHTLSLAKAFAEASDTDLVIAFDGGCVQAMQQLYGEEFCYQPQVPGDLGRRMDCAFAAEVKRGRRRVVLIGSDCPGISAPLLSSAFTLLTDHDLVLGPATDGGYYLIGLRASQPELFQGLPWGTSGVLARTLSKVADLGLRPALLEPLTDIDRPEDLPVWKKIHLENISASRRLKKFLAREKDCPGGSETLRFEKISVIIPALNEAARIQTTLARLQTDPEVEIIVVDGGSHDATAGIAAAAGVKVLEVSGGRARQQNAGAAVAAGGILFFLHADTLVPAYYGGLIHRALQSPDTVGGAFSLEISGHQAGLKLMRTVANLRSRRLQLPYGDQGLFLPAPLFWRLGGFPDQPIMEDFSLIRQLRRHGRVVTLPQAVLTSGRRWQQLGLWRTFAINQLMIFGYYIGVAPASLARLYRRGL